MSERIDLSFSGGADILLERARDHLDQQFLALCTGVPGASPIEKLLLVALMTRAGVLHASRGVVGIAVSRSDEQTEAFQRSLIPRALIVRTQKQLPGWRVDFLVLVQSGAGWKSLIVECDGHDFHERTKEQAAKDRARDRNAQMAGHAVFRFTGSEIWNDAWGCAERVFDWAREASR